MKWKTAVIPFGFGMAGALLYKRRQRPLPEGLAGQVAVVTGASRGLGYLLAQEFAHQGCRVVICARNEEELTRAQIELVRCGAEVLAIPCDVADREQVQHLIDETIRHYGRIDILVNNA
ncbi:MAG: SDR family NAD(P)-dependent oxidoreductase, partial [Anaerolineales bacterium]|nr:SDR family NAD(P)-dependent oxidoreductase [Anaerolineales bacterium]